MDIFGFNDKDFYDTVGAAYMLTNARLINSMNNLLVINAYYYDHQVSVMLTNSQIII